jgi:hypothetical protein
MGLLPEGLVNAFFISEYDQRVKEEGVWVISMEAI